MITADLLEGIVPANPALVVSPDTITENTFIGVTEERANELTDEADALKQRIIGASLTVTRKDAAVIFSYVARTPAEFAFLIYKLVRLMEQS